MNKIAILFFLLAASLQAQDGKHEKIKALKTAYITEQLALTAAEAEKFWPVYNKYDEKFHELRKKEKMEIYKKLNESLENLSEAEANELIEKNLSIETEEVALLKQRTAELRGVISPLKIITLKKVEYSFKKELLDRYRNNKGEKGSKGPQ